MSRHKQNVTKNKSKRNAKLKMHKVSKSSVSKHTAPKHKNYFDNLISIKKVKAKKTKVKKMKIKKTKVKIIGKNTKIIAKPSNKAVKIEVPKEKISKSKAQVDNEKKSYKVVSNGIDAEVTIYDNPKEMSGTYKLATPNMDPATAAFFEELKAKLLESITITPQEVLDMGLSEELKEKFLSTSRKLITDNIPRITEKQLNFLSGSLVHDMLGLGPIEFFLKDDNIEEICVNGSAFPIWVYHKQFGWLRSNIRMPNEAQIWNYSSAVARGVGRQITVQKPLLDAYLSTGDRVNSTLVPISSAGNTITIRKFARKPWTITDFIATKTISEEVAAFLWLAVQYEMSMIISGGTASGKTSMLNAVSSFFPPNQRVISIEQTREVTLPSYLQWVPMVVREATAEGTGEVKMIDLLVNSLRMRPDRMLVGEIRRADEAQVLFEAMHTGHSVYATMHAETVSETLKRLISPPIALPSVMLESLPIIITMFRNRRTGIRRIFEVAELVPSKSNEDHPPEVNMLFKWDAATDKIKKVNESVRFYGALKMVTGMKNNEISSTLNEREKIIDTLVKNNINSVEEVGNVIGEYSRNPQSAKDLLAKAKGKK
jgi:flagellar protein FlaI